MSNNIFEKIGEFESFELFKLINFINEAKKFDTTTMISEDECYCIIIEKNHLFITDLYIGLDLEPENLEHEQKITKEDHIIYEYFKYWRNKAILVGEPIAAFKELCEVSRNNYLKASKTQANIENGLASNLYRECTRIEFIIDHIDNYFLE